MFKLQIFIFIVLIHTPLGVYSDYEEFNQLYLAESLEKKRCIFEEEEFASLINPLSPLSDLFDPIFLIQHSAISRISIIYHRKTHTPYILKEYRSPPWFPQTGRPVNSIYSVTENEFRIGLHLHHPSLVQYHHMVVKYSHQYGWQYFLILEHLNEEKRNTYRNKKNLEQLLTGLLYIYERGVLPYDALPYNIILTKEGNLRLIDFGFYTFKESKELKHTLQEHFDQLLKLLEPFVPAPLFVRVQKKAHQLVVFYPTKGELSKEETLHILQEFVQKILIRFQTEEYHAF